MRKASLFRRFFVFEIEERAAGVPTVVARRSLPDNANLVGRKVATGHEAVRAAADGASLVILEVRHVSTRLHACNSICNLLLIYRPNCIANGQRRETECASQSGSGRAVADAAVIQEAKTQQGGNVPVIAALSKEEPVSKEAASDLVEAGADGVALYHDRLNQTAASFSGRTGSEASHPVSLSSSGLLCTRLQELSEDLLWTITCCVIIFLEDCFKEHAMTHDKHSLADPGDSFNFSQQRCSQQYCGGH